MTDPDTTKPNDDPIRAFDSTESCDAVLGERLRQAFSPIMDEPVPSRFLDLVQQLAERQK